MSSLNAKRSPGSQTPIQTLTTDGGVKVIVKPAPPLQPEAAAPVPPPERGANDAGAPAPGEALPPVIIRPRERPAQEGARDAFVRMLATQHAELIASTCRAEGDLTQPSREDLAQRVLWIAARQFDQQGFETRGVPRNLEGWLVKLIRNEALNYRRQGEREIERADDVAAPFSPAPDPEGAMVLAEKRARLERSFASLTPEEKEVVRLCDLYDMKIDEVAAELQRPWGTVAGQLARGRGKLAACACESERATAAGKRRR
jgi:RNA polymerase sigma factor (sigma-70 family)